MEKKIEGRREREQKRRGGKDSDPQWRIWTDYKNRACGGAVHRITGPHFVSLLLTLLLLIAYKSIALRVRDI